MSSTLKLDTYSSSTTGNLLSLATLAIRRAISCITLNGAANSSFSRTVCSLYKVQHTHKQLRPRLPRQGTHLLRKHKTAEQCSALLRLQRVKHAIKNELRE